MVAAKLFVEGGGDTKDGRSRCREGFHKLLHSMGFAGRMPRLAPCGGRDETFPSFRVEMEHGHPAWVALLVDSEEPVRDLGAAWAHLAQSDGWQRPADAADDQVLLMVTCMESWIVADRDTLRQHYHQGLQESTLPRRSDLEQRDRHGVQDALAAATARCSYSYRKGARSFEILGKLAPDALRQHCPSFVRCEGILNRTLR